MTLVRVKTLVPKISSCGGTDTGFFDIFLEAYDILENVQQFVSFVY